MNMKLSTEFLESAKKSTDLMNILIKDLKAYSSRELQQQMINLFGKKTRPELTLDELNQFIDHLKLLIKVSSQRDKDGNPLKLGYKYEFFKKFYLLIGVNNDMAQLMHCCSDETKKVPCKLLKPYNDFGVPF